MHLITLAAALVLASQAVPNDNRVAAGHRAGGVLTVSLELREAVWQVGGAKHAGIPIFAFAVEGREASIPGPLLRVPSGTEMRVTLHNRLSRRTVVHGLHDHNGVADSVVLTPGETREVRFRADAPGTHMYFARTTTGGRLIGRTEDSQLAGAFIVDDATAAAQSSPRADRVMVITTFDDTVPAPRYPGGYLQVFALNGRSWPGTERLTYALGDRVQWRVINASDHAHPMHLHGQYFTVASRGTTVSDTVYNAQLRRDAVTELLVPASSMRVSWTANRAGNWLFHCHMIAHIESALRLDAPATHMSGGEVHGTGRFEDMMSGLVVAISVKRPRGARRVAASQPPVRHRMRVFVTERQTDSSAPHALSYVLQEGAARPAADSVRYPGSTLVLHQGEPTEITVVNLSRQATSVHWHGLELDSYYDGVSGWSGADARTAPVIAPGDSFIVRLTPVRAGTFMYHSHADEKEQLGAGLFGAFIVLPPGQAMDTTDRILILGDARATGDNRVRPAVNGFLSPPPVELSAGVSHRLRIISIQANAPKRVRLLEDSAVVTWRVVSKDGATTAANQAMARPAFSPFGAGETMDVELLRARPGRLTLEITTLLLVGPVVNRVPVIVR